MKSRSHRLPTHDDWVEESWTVDCVCGVNFDDGEEMVNCDECGVWVHTRCSRYVKSEKSFACDKCKNKNNRNDSEETEVAQLLVELPTKTLRMDNPSSYRPYTLPPARRPFSLWTDIPIEERVHVQGVRGGDPGLFSRFSSVFGPQLWKSAGYVPKKFDFRYREFPCWDEEELQEKELEKGTGGESQKGADGGAGVLLSMSRENMLSAPVADAEGVKTLAEDAKVDGMKTPEQMNKSEGGNLHVPKAQNRVKPNDQNLLQPSNIQSAKRKKEDLGIPKDKSGKKKARIMEKGGDMKKKALHSPVTDRGPKSVKFAPQNGKGENPSNSFPAGILSHDPVTGDHEINDNKCNLPSSKNSFEKSSFDASGHYFMSSVKQKEGNGGHQVPSELEDSSKTIDRAASLLQQNNSGGLPVKGEDISDGFDCSNEYGRGLSSSVGTDLRKLGPFAEDVTTAHPETKNDQIDPDSETMVASDLEVIAKLTARIDDESVVLNVQPSPVHDTKLDVKGTSDEYHKSSSNCSFENLIVGGFAMTISETSNKAKDVGRTSKVVSVRRDGSENESPIHHHQHNRDSEESEDSLGTKKSPTEFGPKSADEPSRSSGTILSPAVTMGECKAVVPGGNSSPASAILVSNSSARENHMTASVQSRDTDIKQTGISESNPGSNKVNGSALNEVVKDEESNTMKSVKELAKSSLSYVSKSSQAKKVLHATVSKRTLTDSKESSSKPSTMANGTAIPCSEPAKVVQTESSSALDYKASTFQTDNASNAQKKVTGSILSQKGEKINQSVHQSSSKVNTTLTHAATSSNSPATLSDEELALLLHQELNSSPRVPRVPRMRHAGSLPQLTSPTATSMLMKRTSSTGAKDHSLTSRRKTKDLAKDGLHGSREVDDETKKMDRVPSSSDHGGQDSPFSPDSVSKREADSGSAKGAHFVKKSNASSSGAFASSSLSSPSEVNEDLSSIRHSPRNPSSDDKGVISRTTHRTLPGLIAEILSKGQHMTYEELCNAVLPHWPSLRKHNGERYAYSSHSQAVLDCLRNRNEWARLVDRGPKTSGGRKRRKLDADVPGTDSEDNDDSKDRTAKEIGSKSIDSHHEEFPKGKRKARKRRRLALQGRGIKDVRRRRRIEELSDDDIGSFSNSSEETVLSEDETEGGGISAAGNEACARSDGTGNL